MIHGDAVFYVPELPTGQQLRLTGAEGRHAATVRRLRVGEQVVITDGAGGMARCSVSGVGKDELELTVLSRWFVEPPRLTIRLAQALLKGDRGELAVELATEAGIDAILPWRAARCIVRWDSGVRGDKALAKWRSTAMQAAKQARRAWIPEVALPTDTAQLSQAVPQTALTLVLHEAAEQTLTDISLPDKGEILLVVGPEGGITSAEIASLTAAGAQSVRLGPTVLRSSTAAAVALGALGVLTSRWRL